MAPNLITAIGLLFIMSASLLSMYYSPNLDQPLPRFVRVVIFIVIAVVVGLLLLLLLLIIDGFE